MSRVKMKFKKGAASFYIVAFSTLILVVIAASFTAIVLSELAKTENDELSQSAYDSALAGVEDAKIAYANYQKCKQGGISAGAVSCSSIIAMIENPECGMVAKILGRNSTGEEVLVEEKSSFTGGVENNMQQAYTCVKINSVLNDYTSTLTEDDTTRVVRVRLNNVSADEIEKVKVSWYATKDFNSVTGKKYNFTSFSSGKVVFPPRQNESIGIPPIISVGIVQTPQAFTLKDFTRTDGGTNRGTVFLVPTNSSEVAKKSDVDNYTGVWTGSQNLVRKEIVTKSNNQAVKNVPLGVYCKNEMDATEDFACSAWLELPKPAGGGTRSDETFIFVVSLLYGQPSTSFSLEFYCRDGSNCGRGVSGGSSSGNNKAELRGMQVEVDSTGRANNLYRRVLTRLEPSDTYFPFPLYAIELLDDRSSDSLLKKPGTVFCEYNFVRFPTCP